MQKIKLKKEPRIEAKHDAFSYQLEAFESIKDTEYAAIFHEQGLGKTKIAIDLMHYWLENKIADTVLVVAKKGLVKNWINELNSHSYIAPKILAQNRGENFYVFNSPSRLILTHYEVLKSEYARFELFLKARDVAVILDESTKIKNPNTSLTKALFKLAPLFKKRIIMTGTPIANRPYDIWAQIWFLDQGKSFNTNYENFKSKADFTDDMNGNKEKQEIFESYLDDIFSRISRFTVRKTKIDGVIKLPEKSFQNINCDWEKNQHNLYLQVQRDMKTIVIKDGVPFEDNAEEILKRLLRLVQIASNPHLVDESYSFTPGKAEVLKDLIDKILSNNDKCIVWSSFIANVDWISRELRPLGVTKIHGKLNLEIRNKAVQTFQSDKSIKILVATPGAAKEGLTLTAANHVIFYDRSFSLDDYLQAQDRIHRISQKKECYVYNLIMRDSIDEWTNILIENKHLASQLAQKDISLDYYRSRITYDFGTIIKNILEMK